MWLIWCFGARTARTAFSCSFVGVIRHFRCKKPKPYRSGFLRVCRHCVILLLLLFLIFQKNGSVGWWERNNLWGWPILRKRRPRKTKTQDPRSSFSQYGNDDPLLTGENPLNMILQITVLSCFACAAQLADLSPNLEISFLLLWPIHQHSHKYLYQLSSKCEQKPIVKKQHIYERKHMKPNGRLHDHGQTGTQALHFSGKNGHLCSLPSSNMLVNKLR